MKLGSEACGLRIDIPPSQEEYLVVYQEILVKELITVPLSRDGTWQ